MKHIKDPIYQAPQTTAPKHISIPLNVIYESPPPIRINPQIISYPIKPEIMEFPEYAIPVDPPVIKINPTQETLDDFLQEGKDYPGLGNYSFHQIETLSDSKDNTEKNHMYVFVRNGQNHHYGIEEVLKILHK